MSCGSAISTSTAVSLSATAQTWNCFMNLVVSATPSGGNSGTSLTLTSGRSSTSATVSAWSRSDTRPSRASSDSRLPPVSSCSRRARPRSASLRRPLVSNASTMRSSTLASTPVLLTTVFTPPSWLGPRLYQLIESLPVAGCDTLPAGSIACGIQPVHAAIARIHRRGRWRAMVATRARGDWHGR